MNEGENQMLNVFWPARLVYIVVRMARLWSYTNSATRLAYPIGVVIALAFAALPLAMFPRNLHLVSRTVAVLGVFLLGMVVTWNIHIQEWGAAYVFKFLLGSCFFGLLVGTVIYWVRF